MASPARPTPTAIAFAAATFALLPCCSREPAAGVGGPLTERVLPVRADAGGPRFRRLDPATSGLAFTNELKPQNLLPYVYSGAGVAVGDYDGDGLPDVYLVSQDGPNKLFRQVAPLRFEDVTATAGGVDGGDAWGTAAAFADVDGDGDLDLYVGNLESPNLLYVNQGNGTFREGAGPRGLAVVAATMGVAFADYDNDGDLDLYILTNRVLGTQTQLPDELVAEIELPKSIRKTKEQLFPPYPRFPQRDGKPVVPEGYEDFFFTIDGHIFAAGQRDRLLRNDGKGFFTDVTDAAGMHDQGNGLSALWWDLDGDGWLDLYVANDLHSPDKLYHNRRDGTFAEVSGSMLPYTTFFSMGSDFGDVDGDGRFDLCVADMSSTTHYMGKMLMGAMGAQRWFLMNSDPQQYMRNMLFLNTGTGRFLEAGQRAGLASSDWTWTVRLCDLDEDGRLDFYATNGIPVFRDDPDAGVEFTRLWRSGQKQQALALLRNLKPVRERNIARRNVGDLRFEDVGAAWGLDEQTVSHGAVFVDLDRDGDLDLIVNHQNQPASVFENTTTGTHRVLVGLRGKASNKHGVGARIELSAGGQQQVRLVMPARGYMSSGEAIEHFGLGANARIDRLVVRWPSGRTQQFDDLAADRHYTITEPAEPMPAPAPAVLAPAKEPPWFVAATLEAGRHRERDFDDYALQALLPHRLSRLGPGLACGDVDGDGRDDLWVGGAAGQAGTLLRARGEGRFDVLPGPWRDDAECEDLGAVLFDCDGDGDLDLFVVSGGIEAGARTELYRDRLYLNDGKGAFTRALADALPDVRHSGGPVVAFDFDRDGDLDLFVAGRKTPGRFPDSPPCVLLRNDGGRFTDASGSLPQRGAAGMVSGAVAADVDGDGCVDLVLAVQWGTPLVWRNDDGARFVDATAAFGLAALRGKWNSIAAADLDNDGDVDLVLGNLGLNTKYKADPQQPLRLFARDFDGDGQFDVVEAKQQGDALLPVRGRSCSSEAMPFLKERFPTYDAFARATLPEIYGEEALQQATELIATELRHVVLENQGGRFAMRPLPTLAQLSPVYGIGIADFDADGRLDLVLAQNSYAPEPETGRFAGGLSVALRAIGNCMFMAVPAAASGIVLPDDAQGIAVLDVDGNGAADCIVATNDGPLRVLASAAPPGLVVRLRGPKGNPTGIGARIELIGAGNERQVRCLDAGSGYLSQSAPAAFFAAATAGSRLVVHWPDGTQSQQAVLAPSGVLEVAR